MTLSRRHICWRTWRHRLTVGLCVVAYLLAAVGFPIPAAFPNDAAGPSPCQGLAGGCPSGGTCGRACCCLRRAAPEGQAAPRKSCCATSSPRPAACCGQGQPDQPVSAGGLRWVGGLSAPGCHGVSTLWMASGEVTFPPAPLTREPFAAPAGWLSSAPQHLFGLALIPPDPPPRSLNS